MKPNNFFRATLFFILTFLNYSCGNDDNENNNNYSDSINGVSYSHKQAVINTISEFPISSTIMAIGCQINLSTEAIISIPNSGSNGTTACTFTTGSTTSKNIIFRLSDGGVQPGGAIRYVSTLPNGTYTVGNPSTNWAVVITHYENGSTLIASSGNITINRTGSTINIKGSYVLNNGATITLPSQGIDVPYFNCS